MNLNKVSSALTLMSLIVVVALIACPMDPQLDTTAPQLVNNEVVVNSAGTQVFLSFTEDITVVNEGNITIVNSSSALFPINFIEETISGTDITLHISPLPLKIETYFVQIASNAVRDSAGNSNGAQTAMFTTNMEKILPMRNDGTSDGAMNDQFGYSVSVDGNTAIVGLIGDDDNESDSGSAYILTRSGIMWEQQAKLLPDDGAERDSFGYSVAIDGDTAIVGSVGDSDNGSLSGSAYIFTRFGTSWEQQAKLLPDDIAMRDNFGHSVAIHGDTAIVSSVGNDDNGSNSGSAYIFTRSGTSWEQQDKLLPQDGAERDNFGWSVSIDGDTAIIGSVDDDDNGSNSGSAYIFTRSGTSWEQQGKLLPHDGAELDSFGWSVAIHGDTAIVGSIGDGDNGPSSGSAYIFTQFGTSWEQQGKLLPHDGAMNDIFGWSVAIHEDTAIVGSIVGGPFDSGSAYIFTHFEANWTQTQQNIITPPDGAMGDNFGYSVAIDGNTAIVGSIGDGDNGMFSGSAYIIIIQ